MAQPCYHPSVEGAQHGAKSLAQFLAYAKKAGAAGAQPSNFMLQNRQGGFQSAKEIKRTFARAKMKLDGGVGPLRVLGAYQCVDRHANPASVCAAGRGPPHAGAN